LYLGPSATRSCRTAGRSPTEPHSIGKVQGHWRCEQKTSITVGDPSRGRIVSKSIALYDATFRFGRAILPGDTTSPLSHGRSIWDYVSRPCRWASRGPYRVCCETTG